MGILPAREPDVHITLQQIGALCFGSALVLACGGGFTGPVYGDGCTSEQESAVLLEGDTLVAQLYVTREYRQVDVASSTVRTTHYRTCQQYRCVAVREDPASPVGDAEATAALTACRAEADVAWAAEHPT